MDLSLHAAKRIMERAGMPPTIVWQLIRAEKVVYLARMEERKKREYVLFHSPAKGACKVAVLEKNREEMVTVLDLDFSFVRRVLKPSLEAQLAAIERARAFFAHTEYVVPPASMPMRSNLAYAGPLLLQILNGRGVCYEQELGTMSFSPALTPKLVALAKTSLVREVAEVVECCRRKSELRYRFCFVKSEVHEYLTPIPHRVLHAWLRTASA